MKPIGAFFMAFFVFQAPAAPVFGMGADSGVASGPRFLAPPTSRRFSDGAIEWSASVSCADPAALLGARVVFILDPDLDGAGDTAGVSELSPADCAAGRIDLRRGLFPPGPAVLRAELFARDSRVDAHALLTGETGSLLSLRRFCARPRNGEPEWIEIRNNSAGTVFLAKVRLEGRALSGILNPGESLTAGAAGDTAELRLWQPGARIQATSSWSSLRNTGDTLRLTLDSGLRLDSVIYGSGASPREDCASSPTEESSAAAHGFTLELSDPRAGPRVATVTAPAQGRYDLRVYDLDGLELCIPARQAQGSRAFPLAEICGRRLRSATVLVQLQPRGAPFVRKYLRTGP